MRIRIDHATTYAYDRAARFIIQTLRLTPRSSEAQQVRNWRVETDVDARLRKSEDAFGNIVHTLYTEQPTQSLTVRVSGEAAYSLRKVRVIDGSRPTRGRPSLDSSSR